MEDDQQQKATAEYEHMTAELHAWRALLPPALEPFYPFRAPNQPMPLYRGQLRVNVPVGEFFVDGTVEMASQPTVQVRYKSFADLPTNLAGGVLTKHLYCEFCPEDIPVVPTPPDACATR